MSISAITLGEIQHNQHKPIGLKKLEKSPNILRTLYMMYGQLIYKESNGNIFFYRFIQMWRREKYSFFFYWKKSLFREFAIFLLEIWV